MNRPRLAHVNTGLLVVIIAINIVTIGLPFLPGLQFSWQQHHNPSARRGQLEHELVAPVTPNPSRRSNTLIMPALLSQQTVYEGSVANRYAVLNQGVWHYPTSSTPDRGGNTVLLAHRFTYTNPRGAFYFLDKLQPGDQIGLIWNSRVYRYRVTDSQVLPPTSTNILDNTRDARLTLFTCTPLWHPVDRLVVTAKLVDK